FPTFKPDETEDIVVKVKPCRQILGSNLWDDILTNFIASNHIFFLTILHARKKLPIHLTVREVSVCKDLFREELDLEIPVYEFCEVSNPSIINDEDLAEASFWIDCFSSIYLLGK
ncbi:24425_t:CDS:2, partial [Gigaspora margarita]